MKVLGINVKTASLDIGAPIHEIGLMVFDIEAHTLHSQAQLFPRIPEAACDQIDIQSLLYSGVTLEEVMHINRPSLKSCLEFLFQYARLYQRDVNDTVFLGHGTAFAVQQIIAATARCGLSWVLPVPEFAEAGTEGCGYLDTAELIGLCDLAIPNRKLVDLAGYFRFDEGYTQTYLNSFFKSTVSLADYFYQDQRWRERSAILDLLRTCFLYQQIDSRTEIPSPKRGRFNI